MNSVCKNVSATDLPLMVPPGQRAKARTQTEQARRKVYETLREIPGLDQALSDRLGLEIVAYAEAVALEQVLAVFPDGDPNEADRLAG